MKKFKIGILGESKYFIVYADKVRNTKGAYHFYNGKLLVSSIPNKYYNVFYRGFVITFQLNEEFTIHELESIK